MPGWRAFRVPPDASIEEAMRKVRERKSRILLVTTDDERLLGVVANADLRRGILEGKDQTTPVADIMRKDPVTAREKDDRALVRRMMCDHNVHQIPVLDACGRVVRVETVDDARAAEGRPNSVVIMAGGLGTRLRPITEECPKPLVEVGGAPILQTILERLVSQGFEDFYLSVNYKADMIEDYFGDGSEWGVNVQYLREQKRRGTAGALSLLPEQPEHPLLVLNGDLLTTLHFGWLVDFHERQSMLATMCVRVRDMEIPYGVVETDAHQIRQIEEKPTNRYFVNAGIYVLEPETLEYVPGDQFYDMTELFQDLKEQGGEVGAYPVQEYWRDVGQKQDLHEAEEEFSHVFQ